MKKNYFLFGLVVLLLCKISAQINNTSQLIPIRIFVVDINTKTKIKGFIKVIGSVTKDTIWNGAIDADTGFVFYAKKDSKDRFYNLWASSAGYWQTWQPIYPDGQIYIARLKRLNSDVKDVNFNCIYFDYDKAMINPHSQIPLDSAFAYLKMYPNVNIQIEGHTDNTGTDAYNLTLSQNRADEVMNYLMNKGISSKRFLKVEGFGSTQPKDTNDTDEGKAHNRRVEIKLILSKN